MTGKGNYRAVVLTRDAKGLMSAIATYVSLNGKFTYVSLNGTFAPARETFEEALNDARYGLEKNGSQEVSVIQEVGLVKVKRNFTVEDFREEVK